MVREVGDVVGLERGGAAVGLRGQLQLTHVVGGGAERGLGLGEAGQRGRGRRRGRPSPRSNPPCARGGGRAGSCASPDDFASPGSASQSRESRPSASPWRRRSATAATGGAGHDGSRPPASRVAPRGLRQLPAALEHAAQGELARAGSSAPGMLPCWTAAMASLALSEGSWASVRERERGLGFAGMGVGLCRRARRPRERGPPCPERPGRARARPERPRSEARSRRHAGKRPPPPCPGAPRAARLPERRARRPSWSRSSPPSPPSRGPRAIPRRACARASADRLEAPPSAWTACWARVRASPAPPMRRAIDGPSGEHACPHGRGSRRPRARSPWPRKRPASSIFPSRTRTWARARSGSGSLGRLRGRLLQDLDRLVLLALRELGLGLRHRLVELLVGPRGRGHSPDDQRGHGETQPHAHLRGRVYRHCLKPVPWP